MWFSKTKNRRNPRMRKIKLAQEPETVQSKEVPALNIDMNGVYQEVL